MIDDHIPPPDRNRYPFGEMMPDQSVLFEDPCVGKKAQVAARVYGHRTGKKFRCRTMIDGSVRIWRIA